MKRDENKSKNTVANVLTVIFLLSEALFRAMMVTAGIFSAKHIIFAGVILLIITLITLILLRSDRQKKGRRRTGAALAVIFSVILAIGSYYLYSTFDLFGTISKNDKQTEDFYVAVLKDGSYDDISDIKGETVFVSEGESDSYKDAKDRLKDEYEVTYENSGAYVDLGRKLIGADGSKQDNIIFISGINYDMLCEEISNFKDDTKILTTVSIEVESTDVAKPANVTEQPFNVYISGIDTYGNINKVSRSDVNMIMTVDPARKKILLTSIPRDMYVTLHSYGAKDKLTHTGIYGVDETVTTVEDWLGIDINYYLRVNFTTLEDVVDVIGGIDVESEYSFKSSASKYSYVKGINHMSGEAALYFARERYAFASGDNQRVRNQQLVIQGIINKIMSDKSLLIKYPQLLGAVRDQMRTNMTDDDISSLVKMQLDDMTGWEIETCAITGTGTMAATYSGGSQNLSVIIPSDTSVSYAAGKIRDMMNRSE